VSQKLFIEKTVDYDHDKWSIFIEEDVVTYKEFVANKRLMKREAKEDRQEYLRGYYNGNALDSRTISISQGRFSCRDHLGGKFSMTLTHRIIVQGEKFELIPISHETLLDKKQKE